MASIDHDVHEVFVVCAKYPKYSVSNQGRVRNDKRGYILEGWVDYNKRQNNRVSGLYVDLYDNNGRRHPEYVHRLVAMAWVPNPLDRKFVDHRDRNTLNNKANNLRWATRRLNKMNVGLQRNNTSGFIGVAKNGSRWIASYGQNHARVHLGIYQDAETAAQVRDIAVWFATPLDEREFLVLNFNWPFQAHDVESRQLTSKS
jgi:hypothetical protein